MLYSIDIKFKTERSIEYQEQEFHENFISEFKHQLENRLDQSGIRTTGIVGINIIYDADIKKFCFKYISIKPEEIISYLMMDTKFYSYYFK